MSNDLYAAAVEKAMTAIYGGLSKDITIYESIHEGQHSVLDGDFNLKRVAVMTLDAVGFREIVQALAWYGDIDNHEDYGMPEIWTRVDCDEGKKARAALGKLKSAQEGDK